jgi:uncharacterized protein (TIGR02117 family)
MAAGAAGRDRTRPVMRRVLRGLAVILVGTVALPVAYVTAAVVLGVVPVNAGFRPASDGVAVYVRTNGVHAEFVLPTRAEGIDWSTDLPAGDMRNLASPLGWVAFGWGDAGFFASTPTWADLRLRTALVALSGTGHGAMHVEYIDSPGRYAGREIRLSRAQYARLVEFVRTSFDRDAKGRPRRLQAAGYFDTDAFYAAVPRYTPWFTSNDWVRRGLSVAGVRAPVWSPFDRALFYQLERI